MRSRIWLMIIFVLPMCLAHAGEPLPEWIAGQIPDISILAKPGVYPLKDGSLLGVGQGKSARSLRDSRAARMALDAAEHDAKQRIARHLFPDEFRKYKTVPVEMRQVYRVSEQAAAGKQPAHVAIIAAPGDVSITPLPDDSIIADAEKVVIPQAMLPYLEDPLLQLGGGRIFSHEGGWLAVGVGLAPLFGKDSVAERDAMKRARLEAGTALTGTIFGAGFNVLEQEAQTQVERNGVVRIREWSSRRTREEIEGELNQAAEVGYWLTDDDHVAVVVAVSNIPLDPKLIAASPQSDDELELPD